MRRVSTCAVLTIALAALAQPVLARAYRYLLGTESSMAVRPSSVPRVTDPFARLVTNH
jgi:hypothetical protein